MGYYYRSRIPFLGDEDASIAFDALQIGLSSAFAEIPSPRHLWRCDHGRRDQLKIELQKSLIL
jgi:hypothetical protein